MFVYGKAGEKNPYVIRTLTLFQLSQLISLHIGHNFLHSVKFKLVPRSIANCLFFFDAARD